MNPWPSTTTALHDGPWRTSSVHLAKSLDESSWAELELVAFRPLLENSGLFYPAQAAPGILEAFLDWDQTTQARIVLASGVAAVDWSPAGEPCRCWDPRWSARHTRAAELHDPSRPHWTPADTELWSHEYGHWDPVRRDWERERNAAGHFTICPASEPGKAFTVRRDWRAVGAGPDGEGGGTDRIAPTLGEAGAMFAAEVAAHETACVLCECVPDDRGDW